MNRYTAFIRIVETGSFSKVAEELGYTQSAVSQMVKSLEEELSTTLLVRSRGGLALTPDGEEFLPYIREIQNAHRELAEKQKEMRGLRGGAVRIGTFASVSCNWLPELIMEFKALYPSVDFHLQQPGEYTGITRLVREGIVDFGFVNPDAVPGDLVTIPLTGDEMLAVLPCGHPLAAREALSLSELAAEPFILLDEGKYNEPLLYFEQAGLRPNIQYRVFDDYTIMAMIEKGMGVSILPELILRRRGYDLAVRSIDPPILRAIGITYRNKQLLPIASRYFIDFLIGKKTDLSATSG